MIAGNQVLRADQVRWTDPRSLLALVIALAICFGAAAIGSAFTFPNLAGWYAGLTKPPFNPPNGIFGPVWSILYTLMAIAAWRVWRAGRNDGRSVTCALALFAVQLVLNVAWSVVFFGAQSPGVGLVVIVLMLAAILATTVAFGRFDRWAALLMVPYIAWVSFATVLNASIWWLN